MRPVGSVQELERRRRLAVERVVDGYTPAEVAAFLGVHVETVRQWVRRYQREGPAALTAKPHPGREPRLTPAQEEAILSWFTRPATEFGFPNEIWTAPRVARLIQQRFGVSYHPRYLNAWLAKRRITPQKPVTRPQERDPKTIQRWLEEDWPRIVKKAVRRRPTSS